MPSASKAGDRWRCSGSGAQHVLDGEVVGGRREDAGNRAIRAGNAIGVTRGLLVRGDFIGGEGVLRQLEIGRLAAQQKAARARSGSTLRALLLDDDLRIDALRLRHGISSLRFVRD